MFFNRLLKIHQMGLETQIPIALPIERRFFRIIKAVDLAIIKVEVYLILILILRAIVILVVQHFII